MTETEFCEEATSRTRMVLGGGAADALARARIAVFGVGGVGGWCAEALARTGARNLTLVDDDAVAPSNVNRQPEAARSTAGRAKVDAMKERILDIAPDAAVAAVRARFCEETADAFDLAGFDYVIDAIDSVDCKALLIRRALEIPSLTLFSSMGAARRLDPLCVRRSPFASIQGDGLARALRNRFRRTGGMPERRFMCVHSCETPSGEGKGSLVQTTGVFGLVLCSMVVEDAVSRAQDASLPAR